MNIVKGNLFIVAAPSGGGKTSLIQRLVSTMERLEVSVSHTTRSPRPGEMEGVNYFFVDRATFKKMLQQNIFLEHAMVYDEYYGTSLEWVMKKLNQGIDIILEIDWQGAQQVRKIMKNVISIFILPPSLSALKDRLLARGQDEEIVINKRMEQAKSEMSHYSEFDYIVVNDDFNKTLYELELIMSACQLVIDKQEQRYQQLIQELIA